MSLMTFSTARSFCLDDLQTHTIAMLINGRVRTMSRGNQFTRSFLTNKRDQFIAQVLKTLHLRFEFRHFFRLPCQPFVAGVIFASWLPTSEYKQKYDLAVEILHLRTDHELRQKNRYYEVWLPVELK